MAKIVQKPEYGQQELNVFAQAGGQGPHFTIWGMRLCLHIYEEGLPISLAEVLIMAQALEQSMKGG